MPLSKTLTPVKTKSIQADPSSENASDESLYQCLREYYGSLPRFKDVSFFPFSIDLIRSNQFPNITIFTHSLAEQSYTPLFPDGFQISSMDLVALRKKKIKKVFIQAKDRGVFHSYIESLIEQCPSSKMADDQEKLTFLRESACRVMSDIYKNPSPENISRAVKTVSRLVVMMMKDPSASAVMTRLSVHDHYTLQHSVGVASNCVILAHRIGIQSESDLIEVALAGMLHDVGKARIPLAILNKRGPLDPSEWEIMKTHAQAGYDILKDHPEVHEKTKMAILQHHEQPNGEGYPSGLRGDEICLYARIVSICDIYNALTTQRPYSSAKPPFEALKIMKAHLNHKYDPKLYEPLVLIYGHQSEEKLDAAG